jgi:pimeloyl-ACP methyl ester carboxylesterase
VHDVAFRWQAPTEVKRFRRTGGGRTERNYPTAPPNHGRALAEAAPNGIYSRVGLVKRIGCGSTRHRRQLRCSTARELDASGSAGAAPRFTFRALSLLPVLRHDSGMEHVDVGGMRIAYNRAGAGPPLVMLHGAPCDSRTWQWMFPDLSRDHTSSPGTPRASGSRRTSTTTGERHSSPTPSPLDCCALSLERPHLVGHSFGTMVALALFQRHPTVPASLALIGGYAGWAGSLPPDEVARRLEMFLGMAELGDAFEPQSYPGLFTDLIPADRDVALTTMMRENVRPATTRAAGYTAAETDLRPMLPTVDLETLILHGAAGARSPLANAEALHAAISISQLVVLPSSAMRVSSRIPRHAQPRSPVCKDHRLNVSR